jgi:hypothetical protein
MPMLTGMPVHCLTVRGCFLPVPAGCESLKLFSCNE